MEQARFRPTGEKYEHRQSVDFCFPLDGAVRVEVWTNRTPDLREDQLGVCPRLLQPPPLMPWTTAESAPSDSPSHPRPVQGQENASPQE